MAVIFHNYPAGFRIFVRLKHERMGCVIKGTVVPGRKLGRKLGFPTANVAAGDTPGAEDGVYAVRVSAGGRTYEGMANLGHKPSVADAGDERLLEVNIFGFTGDIYGQEIEVELVRFIRSEKRFASLDELREAIGTDRHTIEDFFMK